MANHARMDDTNNLHRSYEHDHLTKIEKFNSLRVHVDLLCPLHSSDKHIAVHIGPRHCISNTHTNYTHHCTQCIRQLIRGGAYQLLSGPVSVDWKACAAVPETVGELPCCLRTWRHAHTHILSLFLSLVYSARRRQLNSLLGKDKLLRRKS